MDNIQYQKALEAVYYTVIKHAVTGILEHEGNVEDTRRSRVFSTFYFSSVVKCPECFIRV